MDEDTRTDDFKTTALLSTVRETLDAYEYTYSETEEDHIFLDLRAERGLYPLVLSANDETRLVRIIGRFGAWVPAHRRLAVAELANRINTGFAIGSFEMSFENGDIRYRYGLHAGEEGISTSTVDAMLGIALNALDAHLDAFMSVAFGDIEPAAALLALAS